jgi:hypothetical protein
MKLSAVTLGLFAVAAMASPCSHADQSKHEQKYCAALGEFRSDVKTLQAIGPNSTLEELRAASDRVADDASKVEKEGGKIKTPTGKQFKASVKQLRAETRALPADMTVAQARAKIDGGIQNVKQSAGQLAAESGCPQPAESPTQQGGMSSG